MFKTTRERKLAVAVAVAGCTAGLWQCFGDSLDGTISRLQREIHAAQLQNDMLQSDARLIERAARECADLTQKSLPADTGMATVLYQHWLIDRLEHAGIAGARVMPAPPVAEEHIGHRIRFSVEVAASMEQLGTFLDDFHSTDLLHRITYLSVRTLGNPTSRMRTVTLGIEGISLQTAVDIAQLPLTSSVQHTPSLRSLFAARDVFFRQNPAPNRPATSKPKATSEAPSPSPRKPQPSIQFVGSVLNSGRREAWFVDSITGKHQSLYAQESLSLGSASATILAVEPDSVSVSYRDKELKVPLGQLLSDE